MRYLPIADHPIFLSVLLLLQNVACRPATSSQPAQLQGCPPLMGGYKLPGKEMKKHPRSCSTNSKGVETCTWKTILITATSHWNSIPPNPNVGTDSYVDLQAGRLPFAVHVTSDEDPQGGIYKVEARGRCAVGALGNVKSIHVWDV